MSEYTNYIAVPAAPIEQIEEKLTSAGFSAIIHDDEDLGEFDESMRWIGLEVYHQSSTLGDSAPAEALQPLFIRVVHLFVEEDFQRWFITLHGPNGAKTLSIDKAPPDITDQDAAFVADFFGVSREAIKPHLTLDPTSFCDTVKIPYLQMVDQSLMTKLPERTVRRGSQFSADD